MTGGNGKSWSASRFYYNIFVNSLSTPRLGSRKVFLVPRNLVVKMLLTTQGFQTYTVCRCQCPPPKRNSINHRNPNIPLSMVAPSVARFFTPPCVPGGVTATNALRLIDEPSWLSRDWFYRCPRRVFSIDVLFRGAVVSRNELLD